MNHGPAGGRTVDPIVLAAGTALVGAMATDVWQQARTATVDLWRRIQPGRADGIDAELDNLRTQVLAAREAGDADTEQAPAGAWRLRLHELFRDNPGLAVELQQLLDEHLTPALPADEQAQVRSVVMSVEARDNSRVYMAGGDQHITGA
ncbi:hypothetical protein AB0D57_35920 [Streptomyces sp. NPDC048275]|uniref:hypothetical protein n=1 Tax=Streptomyces sp. NPDC048275 TaxID=3155629 RepID=UPI0033EBB315